MGTPSSHNKMGIELAPFLAKRKPPGALFVPFAGGSEAPDSDYFASLRVLFHKARLGSANNLSGQCETFFQAHALAKMGSGRVHLALRRRDKLYSSNEDNGGNSP